MIILFFLSFIFFFFILIALIIALVFTYAVFLKTSHNVNSLNSYQIKYGNYNME